MLVIVYWYLARLTTEGERNEESYNLMFSESMSDMSKRELCDEYFDFLKTGVENVTKNLLVADVEMVSIEDKKLLIGAIDIGGTYLRVALVEVKIVGTKMLTNVISKYTEKFPERSSDCCNIFWYYWVAKRIVETALQWKDFPAHCGIVFSYPIKYGEDDDAYPTFFPKFWCFENEKSKNDGIKKSINLAINEELSKIQDIEKRMELCKALEVKHVLNDIIATFFAYESDKKEVSIAIILGTGTNLGFLINKNGKKYVYNSEWASYEPKCIEITEEERLVLNKLKLKYNYNHMDVICGGGYIWLIINSDREQIISKEDLIKSFKNSDFHSQGAKVAYKRLNNTFDILACLISAAVRVNDLSKVYLILEGSLLMNAITHGNLDTRIKNLLGMYHGHENKEVFASFDPENCLKGLVYYCVCSTN